jgi:hypothetical protein
MIDVFIPYITTCRPMLGGADVQQGHGDAPPGISLLPGWPMFQACLSVCVALCLSVFESDGWRRRALQEVSRSGLIH